MRSVPTYQRRCSKHGWRFLLQTIRRTYSQADVRVAFSDEGAADLSRRACIPRYDVVTIYDLAVHAGLSELAKVHLDHVLFQRETPPVALGAGRLRVKGLCHLATGVHPHPAPG